MRIWSILSKLFSIVMCDKKNNHKPEKKADDEWEKIWNDIYEFQHTLSIESLPDDEKELEKVGLYIARGKDEEKLFINKKLSTRLFMYRCSY